MYGFFDDVLVRRGEILFDFTVKRIVGELPKSFLLVDVGAPNDYRAAFVGRFDSNVFAFTKVQKCGSFIGFEVGRSTIAIELEFRNIVPAFFKEKIYCRELVIRRRPFRFAVKFLKKGVKSSSTSLSYTLGNVLK